MTRRCTDQPESHALRGQLEWLRAGGVQGDWLFFCWLRCDDGTMPRFVLLYHECPPSFGKPSHWDLMLERDGVLLTWSFPALPAAWGGEAGVGFEQIDATRLADHRLAYLDYEGPIGGERGSVTRVDGGEYDVVSEAGGVWRVRLRGARCDEVIELRL